MSDSGKWFVAVVVTREGPSLYDTLANGESFIVASGFAEGSRSDAMEAYSELRSACLDPRIDAEGWMVSGVVSTAEEADETVRSIALKQMSVQQAWPEDAAERAAFNEQLDNGFVDLSYVSLSSRS